MLTVLLARNSERAQPGNVSLIHVPLGGTIKARGICFQDSFSFPTSVIVAGMTGKWSTAGALSPHSAEPVHKKVKDPRRRFEETGNENYLGLSPKAGTVSLPPYSSGLSRQITHPLNRTPPLTGKCS